jgi:hypothetical protein
MALTSGGNQAGMKNEPALFPVWLKAVLSALYIFLNIVVWFPASVFLDGKDVLFFILKCEAEDPLFYALRIIDG